MSESERNDQTDEGEIQGPSGQQKYQHQKEEGQREEEKGEEDSGCECSTEELERMDTWTKTLVAIKESSQRPFMIHYNI